MLNPAGRGAEKKIRQEAVTVGAHRQQVAALFLNPSNYFIDGIAVCQFRLRGNVHGQELVADRVEIGRVFGDLGTDRIGPVNPRGPTVGNVKQYHPAVIGTYPQTPCLRFLAQPELKKPHHYVGSPSRQSTTGLAGELGSTRFSMTGFHAATAGAVEFPAAASVASSATQRHGMSTQKLPDGSVVLIGLMPSMRRRVEPMVSASARNLGAKEIAGGWPLMLTGTWMVAPVWSESRSVSVRWPGFSQVSRTEFLWPPLPSNDRSHEMSAGRWVSGMVASARNSWGLAPAQKGG